MNPNPRNMTPCPSPQLRDEGLCKYYDGDDGHTEEYASNYYSRNDAYFNDGGDDDDDAHDGDLMMKMTTMLGMRMLRNVTLTATCAQDQQSDDCR